MPGKIAFHILFWILFFFVIEVLFTIRISGEVLGAQPVTTVHFNLQPYRLQLIGLPMKITFFYLNALYLLPVYTRRKSLLLYSGLLLATAGICYITDYFIVTELYLKSGILSMMVKGSYTYYLEKVLPLFYLIILGLSSAWFFIYEWFKNEKQKREMLQMQYNTELALLKYQINPHFLFNTLNNLFSIAQGHNIKELEYGIAKLSGMMRFMIYESNTGFIPLEREVQYIRDYIDIYRLRIGETERTEMSIHVRGTLQGYQIAPFLLIPLVENAIKHGYNFKCRSSVKVDLGVTGNGDLNLEIVNTDHSATGKAPGDSSGIGLQNVKKRLELIYKKAHELYTGTQNGYFITKLTIKLI
jgi:two-component system, LytTR family, sensor kinase